MNNENEDNIRTSFRFFNSKQDGVNAGDNATAEL